MEIRQFIYQPSQGWRTYMAASASQAFTPDLLLAFGSGKDCSGEILVRWWQNTFPAAQLIGCSSAGEILDTEVFTNTITVTAIRFECTPFRLHSIDFEAGCGSDVIARNLLSTLDPKALKLCFVLSDGLHVNGSQLVEEIRKHLPDTCLLTGGLAGDGKRFEETLVCLNADFSPRKIVLLALYGDQIDVEYGSMGGWDSFGPTRLVTRSENNVLFDVDNQNALELYKKFLGPYAKDLPSSALRFPLLITTPEGQKFVRTILAVDEQAGTMTFAGDIPQGSLAELMRANFERLIDGAADAAHEIIQKSPQTPELAILISCVGRRMVLGQRIEEELEVIRDTFGDNTVMSGFYSYGEICPFEHQSDAMLHNQTMTITTLRERCAR
jgi:hypothetical protein